MKGFYIFAILLTMMLGSCQQKENTSEASQLLEEIKQLYADGNYRETLDSIESLRSKYPTAIEERRQALRLWQEASLKMAQDDIAKTDSALQATTRQMEAETRIYERNMLGVKKDSLQARYEAMIGVVRMIRKRMEQNPLK